MSVPSRHGILPVSSKSTKKTSLSVEDLTVPGKGLEMDQNWLIGVYSMNCLENQRSG